MVDESRVFEELPIQRDNWHKHSTTLCMQNLQKSVFRVGVVVSAYESLNTYHVQLKRLQVYTSDGLIYFFKWFHRK
jgi:hypothetical protein